MSKVRIFKRVVICTTAVITIFIAAVTIWMSIAYEIEEVALEILASNKNIIVDEEVSTILAHEKTDTAIIFYPGAKVDSASYLPLFSGVVEQCGVTVFLVDMPLNHAIFNIDAADEIISNNPEITSWYMAGHSLGGAMASDYASDNVKSIDGLIVMGAAVYGDYPTDQSLTIYGTFNSEIANAIDYTDNIVIIEGGNHAQFGNYGKQPGDPDATITAEQQQQQTIDAVKDFLSDAKI